MTRCTILGSDSAIRCGARAVRWSHRPAPRDDSAIPLDDSSAPYDACLARCSPESQPKKDLQRTAQSFHGTAQPFHGVVQRLQRIVASRQRAAQPRQRTVAGLKGAVLLPPGYVGTHQRTVQTGPDLAVLQAILTLSIVGKAVLIGWGWQGFSAFLDMLEIQVDRNDGQGFVFLTYDTTPNYTDTHPLPATPTKWKYRAIYRVGDAQVGVWSNTVEIMVG